MWMWWMMIFFKFKEKKINELKTKIFRINKLYWNWLANAINYHLKNLIKEHKCHSVLLIKTQNNVNEKGGTSNKMHGV
jgi:hypothetical protein